MRRQKRTRHFHIRSFIADHTVVTVTVLLLLSTYFNNSFAVHSYSSSTEFQHSDFTGYIQDSEEPS